MGSVIVKNMEFQETGVVQMVEKQSKLPYYECRGVDELLRAYPQSVTKAMAHSLFILGYIEGKRAERAKRKKTA